MDKEGMKLIAKAVETIIQETLTNAGYKISDLVNSYPDKMRFIVIAGMQLTVNSLKAQFSPIEASIYEQILSNTESIVLPGAFDPRKKGGTAE